MITQSILVNTQALKKRRGAGLFSLQLHVIHRGRDFGKESPICSQVILRLYKQKCAMYSSDFKNSGRRPSGESEERILIRDRGRIPGPVPAKAGRQRPRSPFSRGHA